MTAGAERRSLRRAAAFFVVVTVSVVAGLAALSQTAGFRDWLRRQVLTRVNAHLVGHLEVGAFSGNLFGRLIATDVRLVHEHQRVLAIRRLAATYDLMTLLRGGGLRITGLVVDGMALQLVADERGWNVERLTSAPPTSDDSRLIVDLHDVRIRHGALRVVRPGRAWRLRGLALDGAARFAPHDTHLTVGMLSFTEQGSGLRVEEAGSLRRYARHRMGRGRRPPADPRFGARRRRRPGPNVDLRPGVSRLAASELGPCSVVTLRRATGERRSRRVGHGPRCW
jgi:hypothetical protein